MQTRNGNMLHHTQAFLHTEMKTTLRVMRNVQIKFNFAGAYNLKSKHLNNNLLTSHHEVFECGEFFYRSLLFDLLIPLVPGTGWLDDCCFVDGNNRRNC